MLDVVQSTYKDVTTDPRKYVQAYIKDRYNTNVPLMLLPKIAVPAPPLEVVLAKIGPPGHMMLDAKKQSTIFLTAYTTKERGEQVLFEGQGERLAAEPAAEGPWTERVPGAAYMRFIVQVGNMQGNNLMQICILPNPPRASLDNKPRLVQASFAVTASEASTLPATSVYGLLGVKAAGGPLGQDLTATGVIGYSQSGEGAQAQIAVVARAANATSDSPIKIYMADQDITGRNQSVVVGQSITLSAKVDKPSVGALQYRRSGP